MNKNNLEGYNWNNPNIINDLPKQNHNFENHFLINNNNPYPSFDDNFNNSYTNNNNFQVNKFNFNNNQNNNIINTNSGSFNNNNNNYNYNNYNNNNNYNNSNNIINYNYNQNNIMKNSFNKNNYNIDYNKLNLFNNNNININRNQFNKSQNNNYQINVNIDDFTKNLIKSMSVLNSSKNITWKDNIKSFVSSLYYNNYNFSTKLDNNSIKYPLFIFNKKIDNIIRDELKYPLKSFLYMSYKSNFNNLSNIGCESYTSDCGWGCMLRCCQMLLSKILIQKKIYDFFKFSNNKFIDNNMMNKIRNDILNLFNDNYLPVEIVRESAEYNYFWLLFENYSRNNPIYNGVYEIIPPYSIHILSKLGNCAGVYTSNYKMINTICQINSSIFNTLNFIHFDGGSISKKKIINSFCEESYSSFSENDSLTYNGVDYKFIKGGVVFISLRLGLQNLDESFYDLIPLLFKKLRQNFGLVSGRKNRAYYFIGVQGDNNLIFSDPHLNQEMSGDLKKDNELYYNDCLYLMNIKEMSSAFTFAVGIFNRNHLLNFFEDIKWLSDYKYKDILYFEKD